MNFIDKYSKLIITILLIAICYIGYNVIFQKKIKLEKRRTEIKKATTEFFANCEIDEFDKRRACFHDKMIELRAANKQVNLEYKVILDGTESKLKSEDLGDIIRIERPKTSLMSCSSNTLFLDWDSLYFYISLENPNGGVVCYDVKDNPVYIVARSLKLSQIDSFKKSIKMIK